MIKNFQARKLDENGNPSSGSSSCCASSSSNVSFTTRQLKPLSIYRHNPAFHSQHVSVNQNDEIPPLSPTALQPTTPLTSQSLNRCEDAKSIPATCQSAKARRKKKVNSDFERSERSELKLFFFVKMVTFAGHFSAKWNRVKFARIIQS